MLYHAEGNHCSKILKEMNSLRNGESSHDVCLIVGGKKLHAHKWVLVAVSDYFKSSFIGPLGDKSTTEIDVTSITSDSDALELVLNFIYTGVIDINYEHVGSILKIADYFLLNELKGFCGKFLLDNLTVTNCMMSYLLAIDYSFSEVEKKAELKLRSRIHDFLIYEKSSLEISPEQLLHLINHDFFEHCSVTSILTFVNDWVKKRNTEKHEELGLKILDKFCPEKLPPCTNDKSRIELIKSLQELCCSKENGCSDFSAKLKSIIRQYISQAGQDEVTEKITESSSLEQVLITVSPTDKGIEMAGKQTYPHPMGVPFCDICVYVPRAKSWHHVQTVLEKRDYFSELSAEDENWTFMCLFDRIVVLCPISSKVEEYSLSDFKWKRREIEESILPQGKEYYRIKKLFNEAASGGKAESLDEDEMFSEVGYRYHPGSAGIFSVGQTTCLLLKMRLNWPGEDPDNPFMRSKHSQAFFKCYKLGADEKWSFWFDTPKFETDEVRWGQTRAVTSDDKKELLIVHHDTKKFHIFRADISEDGIKFDTLTPDNPEDCKTSFNVTDTHVICVNEAFYVVAVGEQKKGPSKVVCRYKYSYSSKLLTVCDDNESKVVILDDGGMKYGRWYYPLQYKISECDGSSVWLFGGNTYDESFLKEVAIQSDDSLKIQSHPAPPFSRITFAVAGYMNVDCLAAFKPQKTYLTEIDMNTFERRPYNLLGGVDSDEENSENDDDDDDDDDDESFDAWRNFHDDGDFYDDVDEDEFESDDPDA